MGNWTARAEEGAMVLWVCGKLTIHLGHFMEQQLPEVGLRGGEVRHF